MSAAAACGHERFVGVTQFRDEQLDGNARMKAPVNLQMCRLKFLEIALEAAVPTIHRGIRRAYNAAGPHAAAVCCRSKWFADASYVMLKPLEWLAELLRIFAGVSSRRVRRLYGTAPAE